ncbi:hypothetical protein N386_gp27 [Puniceispirillum phage HMO-2011]|uniref:hypothetical protein n=1 Tax=Puniceispirillum phage HMO-2011 TaxID=948071 RepID=UPI00035161F9|nr:hypothetical protein N386_gp27 [Puniceispirillum phage HMO-2011]AFV50585.1 hypothetical protein phage1322_27 [Puniceispirillum phage HMO-2011]
MHITNAQYNTNKITNENCSISCVIDGLHVSVPLDPANRHYAEIMRQVAAGELTIEDAD